jgi:lysophospholipase L1-like esterase
VPGELAGGPVTLVTLGDSLTYGEGDQEGLGFTGRLLATIDAAEGRAGSTLVNLGQSGWDSTQMVEGQLPDALTAVGDAVSSGRAVLATILIGSNDLWYAYGYTPGDSTADEENAALERYRANLETTVTQLQDAGAVVVVGLPDDQSLRPCPADIECLQGYFPDFTENEVGLMSELSRRFAATAAEVGSQRGAPTVATDDPFWADASTMADDGVHPNGAGYEVLAQLYLAAIEPLL